ncbi:REDY-like protein HapK [Algimonas porphyrae]|uniref:REDY-like protein HapK n=1 Tax=Algimonas porphyrae TaxID=1128113 RepID=A0ABQ5V058_9PROT|nr:hypothetical protein [Algimonas porphyrae]GLQ20015.1 hypothetical protein GCM10007854_09700 [Algimonas porphyrae]
MSQRIIVLFNLQAGKSKADYENWARTKDIPGVNGLGSVDNFEVFRADSLLFSDDSSPYDYIEILDINDMDAFGQDASQAHMQAIAAEFQGEIAKDLVFINVSKL